MLLPNEKNVDVVYMLLYVIIMHPKRKRTKTVSALEMHRLWEELIAAREYTVFAEEKNIKMM